MKSIRIAASVTKLGAVALLATGLTACVVVPVGPRYGVVQPGPVVVAPAPVVVAPPVVVYPAVRYRYGYGYPYYHHNR
jgi:hypothetical protein